MPDDDWPFDQPQNCAVITLRPILFAGAPILHVTHDEDDDGWQFLACEDADAEQAAVACLAEIVRLDPSVRDVADMPPGWQAWRQDRTSPWRRAPRRPRDA
jgi:hypothetical protein